MSISVDTINLRFNVKPDYDQQQLQQLQEDLKQGQKEIEKTRKAMDKLAKNGLSAMTKEQRDEYNKLSSTLSKQARTLHENEMKMKEWTRSANINKLSLQQLGQRAKDLTAVLNNLNPQTDEFREYKEELDAVKERMKELRTTAQQTQESLSLFGTISKGVVALNAALQIKDRVVQWADEHVQAFAKMDDAMTDVMKYTGQTKAEVEDMNEAFKQMTTRTTREELNALAGAAGRLGIQGKNNIIGFVDAADKINVALGDDLGEGAIDQIGKLTMVFGEDKTKGLNGAMLATGSAINVLGANSSANTGFITEFTSSMAGMAVNAKISQTDIMGYASALSQAGIDGQTASGVFAQLITKMFTDPAKFARAAKLDVKAFSDLLKTDANAAILQFLEGLKANGGFDALAPALKSLKMQGTQAVPVISSLINKMDELKKAQNDARQAYDEGTSIIEEFNNANSSAAAKLEMAKKAMNDVSVELGQKLMPIVEGSITVGTTTLKILSTIISFAGKFTTTIVVLTTAIATLTIAEEAHIIKQKAMAFWNDVLVAGTKRLWLVLTKHPYLAIGAAVAALIAIMYDLTKRTDEVTKAQRVLNSIRESAAEKVGKEEEKIQLLIAASKNELISKEKRLEAIDKLKEAIPGYVTELDKETGAYKENKKALDDYLLSLSKKYELEGAKEQLQEIGKEMAKLRVEQKKAQKAADDAKNAGPGYSYTTSWGSTGNTTSDLVDHTQSVLDKANQKLNEKLAERKAIYDAFGVELQESAVNDAITPEPDDDGDGGSGGSGSGNGLDKQMKRRKEKEAQAKADYEKELIMLKQQYQGRKELADEWHQREFLAEENYLQQIFQIQKDYGASQSDQQETANKVLDLVAKRANYEREAEKRRLSEKLQEIDREQAAEEVGLARERLSGEISTEEEYSRRKLEVEIKYQQQRVAKLKEGSAEYLAAQKQLIQLELQQLQAQKKEADDFTKSYQDTNNRMLHLNFEGESFDRMRELNEEYRAQDLISYQQYQQNLSDIAQAETDKRQTIRQAAIDGVNNLLSSASSLFSAMQQRETAAVDAKYKKLIAAARKQGKDTTKLEEQQEAEKAAIQKKYANRNFQIQVLQIVASTAAGIAKTIAELGMPWAIPFVALAAAAGAMQLASAKAAADQAAGLYEGGFSDDYQEGYTRKGDPKKQAGVIPVHQNEFVANHKAVANPEVRPVLDVIDRHQRAGDIQMLNSTRMLEEAYGRGRYRGGYTQVGGNDGDDGTSPIGSTPSLDEVERLLVRIAENTGRSLTVRSLRDEIQHEEQLEKNARR